MNWLQRLIRNGRMEKDLDKELRFHFESQVADKIDAGMSEAEARRATRLEFGGLDQIKEDCRESRGTLWLASILQDVRFGARIMARSPGFSLTAILVLALGIGVNTLAFSLYNLISLQTIPVRDPATLISIQRRSPHNITPDVPYASIVYYRDNARSLSAVMATMSAAPMVVDNDEQRINPGFVTANYFTELGTTAAAGRLFDPAREDTSGATPVAVLSFRFWQRKFGGDQSVIGKTLYLTGKPVMVIGVTPKNFANLGTENPDVWLPLLQHSYFVEGSKSLTDPKFDGMIIMWGRLAAGVNSSQAENELLALTNQLRKLYPSVIWDNERILVTPGAHFFPSSFEDDPPVLPFVALLVLLILAVACANLGGLLMARGVSRRREIQLRLDLGARKSRVFRQLLTESLLLGLLGSIAALPLSYIVLRFALVYANAPSWMSALPDWRVLLFTTAMGLLAALFFGMLPTLQMIRRKKERTLWHQLVVCAQVGASCVLLILAGLLVRATLHTLYADPGFGYEQVVSIDPLLTDHGFTSSAAQSYLDQLQDRLRTVPGVISVSMALSPPLVNNEVMITSIDVDGHQVIIYPNWVSPEFFRTMGIPLLRGRYLRAGETHAVILSESLARKRWPTEDPIGKPWKDGKDIVVGVVGNTRAMELNNTDATEIYYPPSAEDLSRMSVLIRTAGPFDALLPTVKQIAGSIDPKLFPSITPLKAGFRNHVTQAEQIATIISLLGSIAIFLAVVGLLGLVTYAVSQRTKEIAIRLALGASHAEIFSSVLRQFAWPVVVGLFTGVAMTAGLSQIIRRGLYGISGLDPISYLSAIMLLIAILAAAALLPIRRAFKLDIAGILHSE
jgi:predicted permease